MALSTANPLRGGYITRKIANHKILDQLEAFLTDYFKEENLANKGIPTVQLIAERLNVSANYLSRLLQLLTGQSTKQLFHLWNSGSRLTICHKLLPIMVWGFRRQHALPMSTDQK